LSKDALSNLERIASNNGKTVNNEMETIWKVAKVFYRKVLSLQLSGGTGTDDTQDNRRPIRNWDGAPPKLGGTAVCAKLLGTHFLRN
jgi:hypothetical protein